MSRCMIQTFHLILYIMYCQTFDEKQMVFHTFRVTLYRQSASITKFTKLKYYYDLKANDFTHSALRIIARSVCP